MVNGAGVATAVAAPATITGHHTRPRPARALSPPPPRHHVPNQTNNFRLNPRAEAGYVFLLGCLMNLGNLPEQHLDRMSEADPVQRPKVSVKNKNTAINHQDHPPFDGDDRNGADDRDRTGDLDVATSRSRPAELHLQREPSVGFEPTAFALPRRRST